MIGTRGWRAVVLAGALCVGVHAHGQSMIADMLAGALVDPEVGQWAWYQLTDESSGRTYHLRQAIVGEEEINRRSGYWVEFELAPRVGYTVVFRMLLTGPASNPSNVHRIVYKYGPEEARELPPEAIVDEERERRPARRSEGMDVVETPAGYYRAERYSVEERGRQLQVWINNDILPSGIVQLASPDGRMVLHTFGTGGEYAQSVIEEQPVPGAHEGDEGAEEGA